MTIEEKAAKQIEDLANLLLPDDKYSIEPITKRQYNYEFTVSDSITKIKVQVYFGKKGVKTVLQGNQESILYQEINEILNDQQQLLFPEEKLDEPEKYVGTDESGKGDYFGPLVVAAVYVDEFLRDKFKKLGVKDSKLLSDFQIDKIAPRIIEMLDNKYSIIKISPQKYNQLYPKFGNLNVMLNWAHSKAIEEVYKAINFEKVITDKFTKKNFIAPGKLLKANVEFKQFTKGERYIGVAAASILARNTFNLWFKKNKHGKVTFPKGNSDAVIKAARELKEIIGTEEMANYTKLHFKTTKKI